MANTTKQQRQQRRSEALQLIAEGVPPTDAATQLTVGGLSTSSLSNGPGSTKSRTFGISHLMRDHPSKEAGQMQFVQAFLSGKLELEARQEDYHYALLT